jgi:hypothetical protein
MDRLLPCFDNFEKSKKRVDFVSFEFASKSANTRKKTHSRVHSNQTTKIIKKKSKLAPTKNHQKPLTFTRFK